MSGFTSGLTGFSASATGAGFTTFSSSFASAAVFSTTTFASGILLSLGFAVLRFAGVLPPLVGCFTTLEPFHLAGPHYRCATASYTALIGPSSDQSGARHPVAVRNYRCQHCVTIRRWHNFDVAVEHHLGHRVAHRQNNSIWANFDLPHQ